MPGTRLRHIVLITCTPEASTEQRHALVEGLRALPGQIPQIRSYEVGTDAGLPTPRPNADIALVAEFASADDFLAYREHPAHVALVKDLLEPITASRIAIQHDLP